MQMFDARQVADRLPFEQLIDALAEAFACGANVPDYSASEESRDRRKFPNMDGSDDRLKNLTE